VLIWLFARDTGQVASGLKPAHVREGGWSDKLMRGRCLGASGGIRYVVPAAVAVFLQQGSRTRGADIMLCHIQLQAER